MYQNTLPIYGYWLVHRLASRTTENNSDSNGIYTTPLPNCQEGIRVVPALVRLVQSANISAQVRISAISPTISTLNSANLGRQLRALIIHEEKIVPAFLEL